MTRIALIADIHSNVFALEAVLTDIDRRGVDHIINLGDVLYGPVAPRETLDVLRQRDDIITISGNQDRQIASASDELNANATLRFIHDEIGRTGVDWLTRLPCEARLGELYACHGSPGSDTCYLLEDVSLGWPRLRDEAAIISSLAGESSAVIGCAHTHIPRLVQLSSGQCVVNPGSVGMPAYQDDQPVPHVMENHAPHAAYALLEGRASSWQVEFFRILYDHEEAARAASTHGRADWAYLLVNGRMPPAD
ncbi:metallophosphoesterase family protein [Phytohalomonas tamaricis]|uniref:metallophosphoesterase family protein n=1 Tax=Phytohalomonas tamaricis TaxID=2081032 RepID=UPI000D0B74E2|nr:metallophosphoesterase family protein [Phytohalomonas tamaricis]